MKRTDELNDLIESKINSDKPDDIEEVKNLKEEVQDIEDKRDTAAVRKYFGKVQLEGEKPTHFFCSLNKKRVEKAQFEELHITETRPDGYEYTRVITEQKAVEWEVRNFYWNLYKEEENNIDIAEVLESISQMKKVNCDDVQKLEEKITGEEVSRTLKQTRNNIAPGLGGFGGGFL